jgi:hypothetical protein
MSVHREFWGCVHSKCDEAAQQHEQQGTTASNMHTAASNMHIAASRVAAGFSKAFELPSSHQAQLLHLTSSAAARLMASLHDAPA